VAIFSRSASRRASRSLIFVLSALIWSNIVDVVVGMVTFCSLRSIGMINLAELLTDAALSQTQLQRSAATIAVPGSASPSRRAAIFTPSPKMSLSSTMLSPGGSRRELDATFGRDRCVLPGSALLDRDRAAHRVNDASKLDQEAVAGYSLSGRVLFGLRVDHFAEEGLETFEMASDRAASVAPLHALSSGPIIPLGCPE
jgi:hypothetical protein